MQPTTKYLTENDIADHLTRSNAVKHTTHFPEHLDLSDFLEGEPRPAAVLIPLLRIDGSWHVLFTRRNSTLPEHSGQVSFPGGRSDPEDTSPEFTALRETQEEIGIDPADVKILGRLPKYLTITNYLVTPVVGVIPWPYPLHLAEEEVSRVFTIPLDWLSDPNNFRIMKRDIPPKSDPVSVIYFNEYDGEVLWGASARFTLKFIDLVSEKANKE